MQQLSAMTQAIHRMPFGAEVQPDGGVRFRVWAPEAKTLAVAIEGLEQSLPMETNADGWYEVTTAAAHAGSCYRFVLPDGFQVPDPVSRFQPRDASGPSEVIDPCAYAWHTLDWKGRCWEEAVLYELHVGTFTEQGTYLAAIHKLDHLATLGVTAIEIMSIGEFPGARNWGYDGVLLYAPDSNYGRPEDLKALVDAAHERGIMVILDVVYNHFGPEGNYLPQYFPDICTDRYRTPWGKALNFDDRHSEQTREFIIQNALYWVEEFRMDGLRLDAVHAIFDTSSVHILDELAQRVRSAAADRSVHLILESDDTMWQRLIRSEAATPLFSTAQWNHDMRQLARMAMDTHQDGLIGAEMLGRALVEGFTSEPPVAAELATAQQNLKPIPPDGFIAFLQSHDLIGNRLKGERLCHLIPTATLRVLAAIHLLLPQIPMLFMGEEWAASTPFPYFCEFSGDLGESVRQGRLEQFASPEQRSDPEYLRSVPDPLSRSTFESAKLNWPESTGGLHAEWLAWYTRILAVRHRVLIPLLLKKLDDLGSFRVLGPRLIEAHWKVDGRDLRLDANLSDAASDWFPEPLSEVLWHEGPASHEGGLAAWSVRWSLASAASRT